MVPYLVEMTARISQGLGEFADSWRKRQAEFIRGQQRTDGGFGGREGEGDLYYTSFALRSLVVLDELDATTVERVGGFLRDRSAGKAAIVDFFSLIYSATLLEMAAGSDVFAGVSADWRTKVAAELEGLRRDDGGYAKTKEGAASSTYHTFLALICLELLQQPFPEPHRFVEFLKSQRSPEGGFREIRVQKRPATNPTAAAMAAFRILGAIEKEFELETAEFFSEKETGEGGFGEIRVQKRPATNPTAAAMAAFRILGAIEKEFELETAEFLSEMQTDEGGLRANTRIPIADLLSTFTGLLTLDQMDAMDRIDASAALRYVKSLESEQGGFRGAAWDSVEDVEYSFYGLGSLALLAAK